VVDTSSSFVGVKMVDQIPSLLQDIVG